MSQGLPTFGKQLVCWHDFRTVLVKQGALGSKGLFAAAVNAIESMPHGTKMGVSVLINLRAFTQDE